MDDKDYYNKMIINKYNNLKNIENIKKEKIINLKEEIIYNKLKDAQSFATLVQMAQQISAARRQAQFTQPTPRSQQASVQTQQPIQPQPQTPVQSQPTTSSQGKTYDASKMWSPQSFKGQIYEWNRGVISINTDGNLEKENLDLDWRAHHGGATIRTLNKLGLEIENPSADSEPFQTAINGTNLGAIVFHSEGDTAFVYLPEIPTSSQIEALEDVLSPRRTFNISYTHNGEFFDDQTVDSTMEFVRNLRDLSNGAARTT